MSFESQIKDWAKLDSRLTILNHEAKTIRNERNSLERSIISYVEENSLSNATVRLADSKLQFTNNKITTPLTYKFLKECLSEIVDDSQEVTEILAYIRNKREPRINLGIKRYFDK